MAVDPGQMIRASRRAAPCLSPCDSRHGASTATLARQEFAVPIKDLAQLLASLQPSLTAQRWVFICLPHADLADEAGQVPAGSRLEQAGLEPLVTVVEAEGLTLVVPQHVADQHAHSYEGVFRCITLNVNSDLQAVGLTAAVATALAQHHISANVVAGFHHDHILVPDADAKRALDILQQLSAAHQ